MIFTNVGRDGAVDVIIVRGPMPGYAANTGPSTGSSHTYRERKGKVKGGVLEFQNLNAPGSATYQIARPDEMIGRAQSSGRGEDLILKRQSY
jgi:hypothetical protein